MSKQLKSRITCIVHNTTNDHYGLFTDKIILIEKGDNKILLEPEDLRELERVVGGKFKA